MKKNDEKIEENKKNNDVTYEIESGKRKKIITISSITVSILLVILIFSTAFALFNTTNNKIVKGITINNIEINGLTEEEAENKVKEEIQKKLEKDIFFKTQDFESSIKLSQIETNYNIKDAVQKAYNIGRDGNIFSNNFAIVKLLLKKEDIDLEFTYNDKLLDDVITDISLKIPNAVVEPNYYIEDEKLIINRGEKGNTIDHYPRQLSGVSYCEK